MVICLGAVQDVLDGTALVIGYVTVICYPGRQLMADANHQNQVAAAHFDAA